ncbi:MAG: T9SS type A sorting domain-containing protein [Ignavibacteriales bacterium]|nr:T9SS type A sorting domain-containing protein [Ignavibacteriales bacterium]
MVGQQCQSLSCCPICSKWHSSLKRLKFRKIPTDMKLKILFYFKIIFLLFIPNLLLTQQVKWLDISGIQGCYILAEGAEGKLFAVSEPAVYYSTDAGANWAQTSLNLGSMIDFKARGNHALITRYISNQIERNRIEYSSDNGVTWKLIFGNRTAMSYVENMLSDAGDVYAFTSQGGIKLVHYNGVKWDTTYSIDLSSYYYTTLSLIDKSNVMYIVCRGQASRDLLISTNRGISWRKTFEYPNVDVLGLGKDGCVLVGKSVVGTTQEGFVYRTTDGGNSWNYLGLNDHYIYSLTADKNGIVCASTEAGIFRNIPGTTGWDYIGPSGESYDVIMISEKNDLLASAGICRSVQCNPHTSNITPIYKSVDNGIFWSPSGPRKQDLFCLANTNSGILLAGTLGNRIFRTESGGFSWTQLPPGLTGDYVYTLLNDDENIYAGTDKGLYISTDDGNNWKNITGHKFSGSVYSVLKNQTGKLFIGTNFGIYTSSDNGISWIENNLFNMPILFMAKGNNNSLFAVTDKGALHSSSDDGITWNYTGLTREDIQTIETNKAGDIFLGVYGNVLRSTNGGANWTSSYVGNSYVYSIAFNEAQDVFAGTYNGIYQSRNGGLNWTFIGLNSGIVLDMIFDSQQNIIAGLYQNAVYRSEQPLLDVRVVSNEIPLSTKLFSNYPNPFNPATNIQFSIANSQLTILKVFDMLGREVATLVNEMKQPGVYSVTWDASQYSSGIYYYRLQAGNFVETKKLILMK